MKKFGLFGLIVTIFSLFFISCNNITDASSSLNNITTPRRIVTMTVNSDLISTLFDEADNIASSRTLTPISINSTALNYYIGGKDVLYNKNLSVQKVNYLKNPDNQNSGTISFELEDSIYSLTLIAVDKNIDDIELTPTTQIEELISKASLIGETTVDLIYYDNIGAMSFKLSSETLGNNGKYDFSIYLKDWSTQSIASMRGDSIVQTIFRVDTGIYKNGVLQSENTIPLSLNASFNPSSAIKLSGELPAGSYELIMKFNNDNNISVYREDFIVLSNQKTESLIAIPDILINSPNAPTNFKQGYILPSNSNADYYYVLFNWEDNSNTEDYFEIQIQDECYNTLNVTPSTPINESAWNTQIDSRTKSYTIKKSDKTINFEDSDAWFAGTLNKNSTWAAFYFPLGKRYIARIRAVNNYGGSDWCYAQSAATTATIPNTSSTAEEPVLQYSKNLTGTSFRTQIINLYRIKYNLISGNFSSTIPNIYYFDQTITGTSILIPDGTTTNPLYNSGNAITLTKDTTYEWSTWKIGNIGGTDFDTSTNYMGFENLNLYASYTEVLPPPIIIDYSLATNISFNVTSTGTGTQPTLRLESDKIVLKKSDSSEGYSISTLKINYSYLTDVRYNTVKLILDDNNDVNIGEYEQNGNSISIDIAVLPVGSYSATIKAYPDSSLTTSYDYSLSIIIQ